MPFQDQAYHYPGSWSRTSDQGAIGLLGDSLALRQIPGGLWEVRVTVTFELASVYGIQVNVSQPLINLFFIHYYLVPKAVAVIDRPTEIRFIRRMTGKNIELISKKLGRLTSFTVHRAGKNSDLRRQQVQEELQKRAYTITTVTQGNVVRVSYLYYSKLSFNLSFGLSAYLKDINHTPTTPAPPGVWSVTTMVA